MAERRLPEDTIYPNNSDTARDRESTPKKPKIEKVTSGAVRKRKKPIGKRLAEIFGARDGQGVLEYILRDIIVPATQNMIVDSIIDGAEMAILGEVRPRSRAGSRGTRYRYDRVSYRDDDRDRMRRRDDRRDDARDDRRVRSSLYDYEDIGFDFQDDAEKVINGMLDILDTYGSVSVADVYDLSGVPAPDYTVENYGWTNLASATTRRTRDGYVLDLPRIRLL